MDFGLRGVGIHMKIAVAPFGWGEAMPIDVQSLLIDVASHLAGCLRSPIEETIVVVQAPPDDLTPRTHYRLSPGGPVFIQLTARNRKWAQFAYQFSHEFCHVISNYQRLRSNPNDWLHEAICELASAFTLRRMAESWPHRPPHPHWASYAGSLGDYAGQLLSKEERLLPSGMTLGDWLLVHEEELRQDPYQRDLNAVVAYALLPFFEKQPDGWNAIRNLPISRGPLGEYLVDWSEQVDSVDKPFVRRLIGAFQ